MPGLTWHPVQRVCAREYFFYLDASVRWHDKFIKSEA